MPQYRIIKSENGHPVKILKTFPAPNPEAAQQTLMEEQNKQIHMFSHLWIEEIIEPLVFES